MNDTGTHSLARPALAPRAVAHTVSPGLWVLAWRRLRRDRLAMVSLAIVLAFIAMMILSGLGFIARDWTREVGVNYAPPTFVGPDAIEAALAPAATAPGPAATAPPPVTGDWEAEVVDPIGDVIAELRGAPKPDSGNTATPPAAAVAPGQDDTGFVDPLADVMREIEAARRGAKSPPPPPGGTGAAAVDPLADVMRDIEAERGAAAAEHGGTRRATLPFGADKWGRDVIAKTIKGSETSIFVGIAAAFVATLIGTVLGAFAGYYGRWVDDALNWFYSIFSSIPYLLLILAVAAVLQHKGTMTIVLILGLTGWTGVFRLIRAEYLKHKGREYVQAADAIGASNARRMYRHIFPNVSHVVLVQLSILVVAFIKSEVILSFLGFGVPVDVVSWGSMLNEAQNELLLGKWWQLVAAGVSMALLVTAFSLFTDALRDALDPKLRGSEGADVAHGLPERDLAAVAAASDPLVQVRHLGVGFRLDRDTVFEAVKDVSFDIPRNATVALVGESGSGKSVTSLAILGLLPPENARIDPRSEIVYAGRDLTRLPRKALAQLRGADISMIFQEPMTSLNPVFTVGFQIEEVLKLHRDMTGRAARKRAIEVLAEVGIPEPERRIDYFPSQMSGGQQQRVMIAMAIACEPKLLIADEPTTALDVTIQKQILDLIAALQKKHAMSVLFITHDLAVVGEIADHVIVMRNGEIREAGSAAAVFGAPRDAYTRALLQCRPSLDCRPERLPVIDDFLGGEGPASVDIPERARGVAPDDAIVLSVRNLSKSFHSRQGLFGRREFQAVRNVSFDLRRGKTLGLVGESGSGKTTVGMTLMRLHEATSGQALFDGHDILALSPKAFLPYKRRIQIVFQNPYASLNPRFIVGQILTEPMDIHGIGASAQERADMAFELLAKVGLPEASFYKYPHEFSGGQRQRIAIARCLTLKPDILICDESVSALDVSVQAQVLNLLQDLQAEFDLSYIFISHDLAVVKYIADEVMVMSEGEIVEIASSDEIYRAPREAYTQRLLASIPRGWQATRRAKPAPDE